MALTQPKKPVGGAFGVFANERRAGFLKACEGQKASEVSKMASLEWKKLSDAEKAPYQKKYETVKAQYDKDMAAFLEGGGTKEKGAAALRREKKNLKEGKKAKKDVDAPKKPAGGAYGQFLAEKRDEIKKSLPSDHKITDVTKRAGELWKSVGEADKKRYEDGFQAAMEKYKKDFAVYMESKKSDEPEEGEEEDEDEPEQTPSKKDASKKEKTPKLAMKRKASEMDEDDA